MKQNSEMSFKKTELVFFWLIHILWNDYPHKNKPHGSEPYSRSHTKGKVSCQGGARIEHPCL